MRFGAFWQVPGYGGSSVARRHWETIEEIVLAEQLGFESAWLAESVFYPTRPFFWRPIATTRLPMRRAWGWE